MTNIDRIINSRDITLSTMVHLVKAMVFPVVMYGCEPLGLERGREDSVFPMLAPQPSQRALLGRWVAA